MARRMEGPAVLPVTVIAGDPMSGAGEEFRDYMGRGHTLKRTQGIQISCVSKHCAC